MDLASRHLIPAKTALTLVQTNKIILVFHIRLVNGILLKFMAFKSTKMDDSAFQNTALFDLQTDD